MKKICDTCNHSSPCQFDRMYVCKKERGEEFPKMPYVNVTDTCLSWEASQQAIENYNFNFY